MGNSYTNFNETKNKIKTKTYNIKMLKFNYNIYDPTKLGQDVIANRTFNTKGNPVNSLKFEMFKSFIIQYKHELQTDLRCQDGA